MVAGTESLQLIQHIADQTIEPNRLPVLACLAGKPFHSRPTYSKAAHFLAVVVRDVKDDAVIAEFRC